MTLHRIDFPVLARGMNREAPIGTLNPNALDGPLWRELVNLVPHEGELRRREALAPTDLPLPDFLDDENQEVLGLYEIAHTTGTDSYLLVTTRELFYGTQFGWTNITPRYETGTVSVTSGTSTVSGVGTEWSTRAIADGTGGFTQAIELPDGSGDWYEIASVSSDTALSLAVNYAGTTLAGASYSIRRTFAAHGSAVFIGSLNGDLYVAGKVSTAKSGGLTVPDGGVLSIAGGALASYAAAPSTVSFLTSGETEVEAGIDILGYFIEVRGFTVLADGRLVVLTRWNTSSTGGGNRVHYSSLLNLAVWTASPGGFTDITDFETEATAMTGGGRSVYVHFEDGVEVGDLTGAQDPPLRFRPSTAGVGAAGPRAIATTQGGRAIPPGDVFIGGDGVIYHFNGSEANPVRWASSRNDLRAAFAGDSLAEIFTRVDSFRGYVSFFYPVGGDVRTVELRLYFDAETYLVCRYETLLTAAATPFAYARNALPSPVAGIVGTERLGDAGSETGLLYELRDDLTEDDFTATAPGSYSDTVVAVSDFFTDPTRRWALSHLDVTLRKVTDSVEDITVKIVRDGDTGETLSPASVAYGSGGYQTLRFYPASAASGRLLQIRIVAGTTANNHRFDFRLSSLRAWMSDVGEAAAT